MVRSCKRIVAILLVVAFSCSFLLDINLSPNPIVANAAGNQIEDLIGVASGELGFQGTNNKRNKYTLWCGQLDPSEFPDNGYGYEWCQAFVGYCAAHAGIDKSTIPYNPGTATCKGFFTSRGLWHDSQYHGGSYTPKRGDLIYFQWQGRTGNPSHVGIVTGCDGSRVYTIEGNTGSDQVLEHDYALGSSSVQGYGTPAYTSGGTWYSGLTPANLGDTFYAYIINQSFWKMATMDSDKNISLRSEKRCGNQLWKFVRQSNGSYVIYNGENAEYRYVLDSTGVSTPEANVYAYDGYVDSSAAQRWFIYEKDGGYFLRSEITDCVLDVTGGNSDDGTNIWMFTYNGTEAQKFSIYREDDLWYRNMPPCNLGDDFYAFIINNSMWKHLTKDADNNVTLRSETGDDNQFWRFVRQNDGTYAIYNGENGEFKFVLDSTGTHEAEANVYTYSEFVDGAAQKWYIHGTAPEFYLHTQCTDCVLDVSGGNSADGTNIQMFTFNDTTSQKFQIYQIQLRKITFDANGGTCSKASKNTAYESRYGTLPTPTRDGYTFNGWYTAKTGGTKITSSTKVTTTGAQTLYAQWTKNGPKTYKVTFDANGGKVSPASVDVTEGSTYGTLPKPTYAGYTFLGWYTAKTGGTQITDSTKVSITAAQTLYAHWKANTYNVTFNANEGEVKTSSKQVTYNSTYGELPTPTRKGYTFSGWFTAKTDGSQVKADTKYTATSDQTLYARWKGNSYTVTFNATGGSVETSSKAVTMGSKYGEMPTPTLKGNVFQGWYTAKTGGASVDKDTVFTGAANQTLYAQWVLETYTVTLDPTGGDLEELTARVMYSKQYGELPTPEKKGYKFVGWFTTPDDGTEITTSTKVTLNKDHTLYAQWVLDVPEQIVLQNGEQYALSIPNSTYTFKSNNTNVAIVSSKGLITAIGEGEAVISIIDPDFNVVQISITVIPVIMYGDCNGDGEFNVADAVLLQKWLLAVPDTHFADWRAADFTKDNRLDVFDLCLMKRELIHR